MDSKTINILLVEGSQTPASRTCAALEAVASPLTLTTARNIAEARSCLAKFHPDLILLNSSLSAGNGIELLSADQGRETYPAIILADSGNMQTAIEAMQAGALDYLIKPETSVANLTRAIEKALHKSAQIAEHRRAEQTLRKNEDWLRSFFESSATGMGILDPEGKLIKTNATFLLLSGYTEPETLGKSILEFTHPEDREATQALYEEIRTGRRRIADYEKRYLCRDGSIRWGHATIAGVFGENEALNFFVANVQDITESKLAQKQIQESQQMLQLVLDYIPQHVFWKDTNSVYLGCNRNFARIAGMENPQDLIGKSDYDLPWKREESDFFRECDRRVMETDRPELHIIEPQLQAHGKQAWLDANKIPLHDSEGRVTGILGTLEDITARKQAEEELIKANRELDAFVYTVSHDLRAPLTPIIGYAELLQVVCREQLDKQSLNRLATIGRQGQRMLALLEDLLTLAKVGQLPRPTEPVALDSLVKELLIEMGSLINEHGIVVKKSPLPEAWIPKTQLEQIFSNLLGNAIRYAGSEGSPLEIGGERKEGLLRFYIRDHGPGIPQEESERIFEVFYRGPAGEKFPGTGIGLATVQKIAHLHKGQAWVEETPGGGSTFWVELQDAPETND